MVRISTVFVGVLVLMGCASTPTREAFHTRLYQGAYDEVWLAALRALNDYPLKVSNKDAGKIQTETVNGPYNELLFAYPDPIELPERFRYSMRLNFAKLETERDGTAMVRIRLIKDLEKYQDFYAGWLAYDADGLEEKVLLYRIEHILQMERSLLKGSSTGDS